MESSQYFIAKSDKYVLVRKIGNRFFRIISDTNITPVELIYQKICSEGYTSEQELFQDIFDIYGYDTEIIAASIRFLFHVTDCALAGADIATIPYKVIEQMTKHPLTD